MNFFIISNIIESGVASRQQPSEESTSNQSNLSPHWIEFHSNIEHNVNFAIRKSFRSAHEISRLAPQSTPVDHSKTKKRDEKGA